MASSRPSAPIAPTGRPTDPIVATTVAATGARAAGAGKVAATTRSWKTARHSSSTCAAWSRAEAEGPAGPVAPAVVRGGRAAPRAPVAPVGAVASPAGARTTKA